MKRKKLALTLLLCSTSFLWLSCSAKSNSNQTLQQTATAQRGNLVIAITGSGNLALSHKEDLPFDMAGFVEQVAVKEGDYVKKGDVLANLNTTDDWEAQITSLQRSLTSAQRQVNSSQRNETAAERKVAAAEQALADAQKQTVSRAASAQQALLQAEISAKNAGIAVAKAQGIYTSPPIVIAQADMRITEVEINYDNDCIGATTGREQSKWLQQLRSDISKLDGLRAKLNSLLPVISDDDDQMATLQTQLQVAQSNLKDTQDAIPKAEADGKRSVNNAQYALDDARLGVEDAKTAIEDAQTTVDDAQAALNKANSANPVVKAPFDGFVTMVNVNGGDEVKKGTIALQIADPTKFQAQVSVGEKDYPRVKLGAAATVQLNALRTVSLAAKVTYIAPTSSTQSGAATYAVKVDLQPVQTRMLGMSAPLSDNQSAPATAYQLTEGASVLVNIVIDHRENVVLVPNEAITAQGRQSVVNVLSDNQTQARQIKTGIADWQFTEVTDGLKEGEQVVWLPATARPTTTSTGQRQGQMPQQVIPGVKGLTR